MRRRGINNSRDLVRKSTYIHGSVVVNKQRSCTESPTAAANSVCAVFTLTWEGEKQRRDREVRQFGPNREWHHCQLAIPSQHCSLVLSVCVSLCSLSSAREEIRAALQSGNQPAISARHLGTVCPLSSFPRSQRANNGRGGKCCCGQRTWEQGSEENSPNGVFIWGREPHTKTAHLKGGSRAWGKEFK